MGCCNEKGYEALSSLSPDEKDFSFLSYDSDDDETLEKIDKEYNIFHAFSLLDYISNLEEFNSQQPNIPFSPSKKTKFNCSDAFLNTPFSNKNFSDFLEKKLLSKNDIKEMFSENIQKKFIQISNMLFEKYKILKNNNIVKKDLIPLGLMFCKSSNKGKIQILYDLNSNPNFEKNDILFKFLKNIFLLCLIAEYSTKKSFDEKFSEEDNNEIIKISEDLANKFITEFFKDKNVIENKDFEKKFKIKTNDVGWIFNPNGIRNKINKIKKLKNDLTNLTTKENDIILNNDIIINDDIKNKKNVIIEDIKEETKNDNKNEKKLKSKKKNIKNIQNETKKK